MDLKVAGKQKFFRIEIESRGGIFIQKFPCDGKLLQLVINYRKPDTCKNAPDDFAMKIGNHSFPAGHYFLLPELQNDPNTPPKIKNPEYKFKKGDLFQFRDYNDSIKEVILYVE